MKHAQMFVLAALLLSVVALPAGEEASVVLALGPVWKRHTIDNTSRGADGVKLGDINRDGLPDIVTGWEEGGEVRVYLNPGPAKARDAWPGVAVGKVGDPEDAIFADLDGDDRLEVVSCTEGKTRTVFWHRPTGDAGRLMDARSWSTLAFPATLKAQMWMQAAVMDVDGEHGMDLLLASKNKEGAVGWLQAPESPGDLVGWRYHRWREAGWVMSLVPQDMDGDGDLDVITCEERDQLGVVWYENPYQRRR